MSASKEIAHDTVERVSDEAPGDKKDEIKHHEVELEAGNYGDSKSERGPDYSSDDFMEGASKPIETSTDLVTKIIHVQDDKTLNALTFRTVFLGKFKSIWTRGLLRADGDVICRLKRCV